jgi:hemoglobin-like flavoprotein
MNKEEILSVRESYIRCVSQRDFPTTFYERFIDASPMIKEKFKDTYDIKKTVMVTRGLNALIKLTEESQADDDLKLVAQKHNRDNLDISPSFYPNYKFYMLKNLEKFDPKFDKTLKKLWEEILDTGIEYFIQNY